MTKVVLDPQTAAQLDAVGDRAELCDPSGRVLGFDVSRGAGKRIYYAGIKSPVPQEELDRRYREEESRPLSDVWSRLKPQP